MKIDASIDFRPKCSCYCVNGTEVPLHGRYNLSIFMLYEPYFYICVNDRHDFDKAFVEIQVK